jgi:hypothetical protein
MDYDKRRQKDQGMIFDIQYDAEQDFIRVVFSGRITMSVVREYISTLLPVLKETDCRRLLSDCSQAEVHLTSSDIMQFPKMAADSPLTARLKRAVVATPGTSGYDLYETLSRVMSQQLRVFDERDEALAWLLKDTTE